MANPRRGEIEAVFDGRPYTLVLTLGALAELEAAFGAGDLMALAERFESGRLSASDAIDVLRAGIAGGGHVMTREDVARLTIDGGAAAYVRAVADLLAATFGRGDEQPMGGSPDHPRPAREPPSPAPALPSRGRQ